MNPGEFFAVATEVFFCRPLELRAHEPALYDEMAGYYGQDPAARAERAASERGRGSTLSRCRGRRLHGKDVGVRYPHTW